MTLTHILILHSAFFSKKDLLFLQDVYKQSFQTTLSEAGEDAREMGKGQRELLCSDLDSS